MDIYCIVVFNQNKIFDLMEEGHVFITSLLKSLFQNMCVYVCVFSSHPMGTKFHKECTENFVLIILRHLSLTCHHLGDEAYKHLTHCCYCNVMLVFANLLKGRS